MAVTANSVVLSTISVSLDKTIICPICQSSILSEEECVACPDCSQEHHRDCWSEIGGCGTYGCSEAPDIEKQDPATSPRVGWGETKRCPACGENIPSDSLRCHFCRTEFDSADPMSRADLTNMASRVLKRDRMKRLVVTMFIISLVACLAPLMFFVSAAYLYPRRDALKRCGPIYQVLAWTSLGLSGFYTMLLLLFIVLE